MESTVDLSQRLAQNLQQWVAQARRALDDLKRCDLRSDRAYSRLRSLHNLLEAEVQLWERHNGEPQTPGVASGDDMVSRMPSITPASCMYCTGKSGSKQVSCCGGKKRDVPAYGCLIFGRVTGTDCRKCRRYTGLSATEPRTRCDYLILARGCDDCDDIKVNIGGTVAPGRRLAVIPLAEDEEARIYLDGLELSDAYVPCLIPDFEPGSPVDSWTDDPADIIAKLDELRYTQGAPGYPVARCVFALSKRKGKQWGCAIEGTTTREQCRTCPRRILQAKVGTQEVVDVLVGVKTNEDTLDILARINSTTGLERELCVINAASPTEARKVLLDRFKCIASKLPILIERFNPKARQAAGAFVNKSEILCYLERNACINVGG